MTTTTFTGPTAEATAEFVEWLRGCLRAPQNAERHAEAAIGEHDWSRSLNIEVRGFYTRSGNPDVYTFARHDVIDA